MEKVLARHHAAKVLQSGNFWHFALSEHFFLEFTVSLLMYRKKELSTAYEQYSDAIRPW